MGGGEEWQIVLCVGPRGLTRLSRIAMQGATYIYINHLSPFLTSHEGEIDAAMTNARASATKMGMDYLNRALRQARAFLLGNLFADPNAPAGAAATGVETAAPDRPPVLAEPELMSGQATTSSAAVSGLARFAGGLLRQYAPAAIAAGTVLLQPMSKTATTATTSARAAAPGGGDASERHRRTRSRRQELEAELAALGGSDDAATARSPSSAVASEFSSPSSATASESESSSAASKSTATAAASLSWHEVVVAEARESVAAAAATASRPSPRPPASRARKSGSWFGSWGGAAGGSVDAAKKDA